MIFRVLASQSVHFGSLILSLIGGSLTGMTKLGLASVETNKLKNLFVMDHRFSLRITMNQKNQCLFPSLGALIKNL